MYMLKANMCCMYVLYACLPLLKAVDRHMHTPLFTGITTLFLLGKGRWSAYFKHFNVLISCTMYINHYLLFHLG